LVLYNLIAAFLNPHIRRVNAIVADVNAGGPWTATEQAVFDQMVTTERTWAQDLGTARAADLARAGRACASHAAVTRAFENDVFRPLPVPGTNGTAACNADVSQVNYLNTMLSRAFDQLGFRALSPSTNFEKTVPIQQLQTQINRLDAKMAAVWGKAWTVDCL
jgi:hypothetical protein